MRKVLLLYFILVSSTLLSAPLVGRIIDYSNNPIPCATVAVFSVDSILLTGTISDENGIYTVDLPDDAVWLSVSYIGYASQRLSLSEISSKPICLQPESAHMDEVVVQARVNAIERKSDKVVMKVASLAFSIGISGKDILQKAPGVNINRQGKVTLNGKEVDVYIDGKPSYLSGDQLKAMLEGMNGCDIDQIEIMSQPFANYDAAGQGGIINIKSRRNLSLGLNGSLSATYGAMYWRDVAQYVQDEHVSCHLHYKTRSTYTSIALTQSFSFGREAYEEQISTPMEVRLSNSQLFDASQYYSLKVSNEWHLDTMNILGFMVNVPIHISKQEGSLVDNTSVLYKHQQLVEEDYEHLKKDNQWFQHAADISYTHIFDAQKEQEIKCNLDYTRNTNGLSVFSEVETHVPKIPPAYQVALQTDRQNIDIFSVRLDFSSSIWSTGKIECGGKCLTTNTAYHSVTDTRNEVVLPVSHKHTEHIAAFYTTLSKQFTAQWNMKIGLRGEYTYTIGHNMSGKDLKNNYFNLFPSVYVGYMPTPDWLISLAYSRRIQRPTYDMLDPTILYESAHTFRQGDSKLLPEFTHHVIASFGFSEYISLDFHFSHTTNWIEFQTILMNDGDRLAKATNYGTNTSHGIFLSLNEIPLVPKWDVPKNRLSRRLEGSWLSLSVQVGASRETFRSYDQQFSVRQWAFDCYAALTANLPKHWFVSLDTYYASPSILGTEYFSRWIELNMAVKKEIPKANLTLTARFNDLLLSSRWCSRTMSIQKEATHTCMGNDYAHLFSLGLQYRFGRIIDQSSAGSSNFGEDELLRRKKSKREH